MGKYGLKSGYGKFQNIQADNVSVTVDSNGDGSSSVTFKRKFKNAPTVLTKVQQSDNTITESVSSVTNTGFTLEVDSSETTGDSVTVGYVAIDDPKTGFA